MKKLIFVTVTYLASMSAQAAVGSHTVLCNVKSFDSKQANLGCFAGKKEIKLKALREWMPEKDLKVGKNTRVTMSNTQHKQFLAMNKLKPLVPGKSKSGKVK